MFEEQVERRWCELDDKQIKEALSHISSVDYKQNPVPIDAAIARLSETEPEKAKEFLQKFQGKLPQREVFFKK